MIISQKSFNSSSLQNRMTGAGWNFFCSMIVNPNQPVPSSFPIISYRSLLFDNPKIIPFEQLNQLAEFQLVSPIFPSRSFFRRNPYTRNLLLSSVYSVDPTWPVASGNGTGVRDLISRDCRQYKQHYSPYSGY